MAATYDAAPEEADLATAESGLTGERVNRFLHVTRSAADLVAQGKMQRRLGQVTGTCFQRCVGMDAINSLFSLTYDVDAARGTGYHPRFLAWLAAVQHRNLVVGGAMTDVKGDRSKGPGPAGRSRPLRARGGPPPRRHRDPRGQGAPDRGHQLPLAPRHARPAPRGGGGRLRRGLRRPRHRPRPHLHLRAPVCRHAERRGRTSTWATPASPARRPWSSSTTCSSPASTSSWTGRPSSPPTWWSASPPITAAPTSARPGWATC